MRNIFRNIMILVLSSFAIALHAQKAEISEAKGYMKSNTNLDKAESLIRKVMAMPEEKDEIRHYVMLTEVLKKQYANSNEKLYLRQLSDTASIFPILRKMFVAYEALDSMDAVPGKNGKVKIRYRKKNAEYLNRLRPNLFTGGIFSAQKKNYAETYACMDMYLDAARQPLFTEYQYSERDTLQPVAAYWATVAARKQKEYSLMMKYADMAQQNKDNAPLILAMLHEAFIENNEGEKALTFLRKGFEEYPEFPYFFPRLVDYYATKNAMDSVAVIVDRAMSLEPGNMFYRLAKNNLQLNLGQYDECIALGDSLIHNNDQNAEAYYNVGSSYFNKALVRDKQRTNISTKRKEVNALYEKALPYIERYRTLNQKDHKRWAPMLYTIYLNLNKGKEFEEIEELLKKREN